MIKFIRFIKEFMKYGREKYPYLFVISLVLYLGDLIQLIMNKHNELTIIAIVLFTIFFGGILIGFILDKNKENNYDKFY